MPRENGLLSIGEISKLTGASLRSLRYYEKLGLLTPAHVDPFSAYRYYTFDQAYQVEMIMFCVELDIPLKALTTFTDAEETINFRAFLAQGKAVAQEKLKKIRQGLALIRDLEEKMNLAEQYDLEVVYKRDFAQKHLFVKPCGTSLQDLDLLELFLTPTDLGDMNRSAEYGFLCEHSPAGRLYYAFMEVTKSLANKTVPAGTYRCRQSDAPQIEQAHKLFHFTSGNSYLVMESEIFTGEYRIKRPRNEVRVIELPT